MLPSTRTDVPRSERMESSGSEAKWLSTQEIVERRPQMAGHFSFNESGWNRMESMHICI